MQTSDEFQEIHGVEFELLVEAAFRIKGFSLEIGGYLVERPFDQFDKFILSHSISGF